MFDWLSHKSSILYFAREISARIKFGRDTQKGAKEKELSDVKKLLFEQLLDPDRHFKNAWKITLKNLGSIFDFCKDRDIPILLVIFPYPFQFNDVNATSSPQKIVGQYAIDNNIPVLDLLPILALKMKNQKMSPEELFHDFAGHLSPIGSKIVAEVIADFTRNERLINHSQKNMTETVLLDEAGN